MNLSSDRRVPQKQNSISRMEEKRRQRKKRQKRRRAALTVLVVVLCVLSFLLGRISAPVKETNGEKGGGVYRIQAEESGTADGTDTEENTEISREDMEMYILSHPDEYPSYLREFMESNPEALEFVYSYPEYRNLHQEIDITEECREGEIPLFIQWDMRWGYEDYGDDMIALSGCGPVCLSMVYVGLTGDTDMNPAAMAEFSSDNGFYLENVGTSWELMSSGAELLGLSWENPSLHRSEIYDLLDMGCPLICSMKPGDFTSTGHFIVIYGREGDNLLIHDPNSPERSGRTWSYDQVESQIKNIWAYSADGFYDY